MFRVIQSIYISLLLVPQLVFSQCLTSSYIIYNPENRFDAIENSMCFGSPDLGYYISNSENNNVYCLRSTDIKTQWDFVDTIFGVHSNNIAYNFGFGCISGNVNDTAILFLFNEEFSITDSILAHNYSDILEINIVDSTHIIFTAIDRNQNNVIGVVSIKDLNFRTCKSFGQNTIAKIDFFSKSEGWYQINSTLCYTNNQLRTSSLIVANILDFDFYSISEGMYLTDENPGENVYVTEDAGKHWRFVTYVCNSIHYECAVMNSPHSIYLVESWQGVSAKIYVGNIDIRTSEYGISVGEIIDSFGWNIYAFYTHIYIVDYYGKMFYLHFHNKYTNIEPTHTYYNLFLAYPNPCKDYVYIHRLSQENFQNQNITICNRSGKLLKTIHLEHSNLEQRIDVSELPSGVYYVHIETESGIDIRPIVIQR